MARVGPWIALSVSLLILVLMPGDVGAACATACANASCMDCNGSLCPPQCTQSCPSTCLLGNVIYSCDSANLCAWASTGGPSTLTITKFLHIRQFEEFRSERGAREAGARTASEVGFLDVRNCGRGLCFFAFLCQCFEFFCNCIRNLISLGDGFDGLRFVKPR